MPLRSGKLTDTLRDVSMGYAGLQATSSFASIRAAGLLGITWLNTDETGYESTRNRKIRNDSAILSAFRKAAS
jgi:hypothetical protein